MVALLTEVALLVDRCCDFIESSFDHLSRTHSTNPNLVIHLQKMLSLPRMQEINTNGRNNLLCLAQTNFLQHLATVYNVLASSSACQYCWSSCSHLLRFTLHMIMQCEYRNTVFLCCCIYRCLSFRPFQLIIM